MATPLVEPISAATAAPTVEPTADAPTAPAKGKGSGGLPSELLQLPAFQALFAGQPPALSAPVADFTKRPETKLVADNKSGLMKAGIGFYRSVGGDLGVVFNQMFVSGEELKAADAAGQLLEIAPPFDTVSASVAQSGANNPVLNAQTPSGPRGAPVPTPPQSGGKSPSAASQRKVTAARVMNIQPGAPTSGPSPGAGRLLNSILKPVI